MKLPLLSGREVLKALERLGFAEVHRKGSHVKMKHADAGCAIILTEEIMKVFTAVIERCPDTKLYVGYVPGFPGAHSQGESLDELNANLREVIEMLLQDGEPRLEADFVGTQTVMVA